MGKTILDIFENPVFQDFVMGMYLPIIALSGLACLLFVRRIIWPAVRGDYFNFKTHAVALSATLALAAHFTENVYYGVGRINHELFEWMSGFLPMVALMKMLILVSAALAVAVYNDAIFGFANFRKIGIWVAVLWVGGSVLAHFFWGGI